MTEELKSEKKIKEDKKISRKKKVIDNNKEKNLLDFDKILEEIFEEKFSFSDEDFQVSNIPSMITTKNWKKINTKKGNLTN
jgi:hypothetical protein